MSVPPPSRPTSRLGLVVFFVLLAIFGVWMAEWQHHYLGNLLAIVMAVSIVATLRPSR